MLKAMLERKLCSQVTFIIYRGNASYPENGYEIDITIDVNTVNSLVSDNPWCMTKLLRFTKSGFYEGVECTSKNLPVRTRQ